MKRIIRKMREKRGDGYIDVAVFVLVMVLVLATITKVVPAFILKNQLNQFASEALRQAQIKGEIDIDCSEISKNLGITPEEVIWEADTFSEKKIQLDGDILVIAKVNYDIGLFGDFGSFSIPLVGKASGKSEVYWK
ncbi:DUF4320 family protein [Sporanaerobacter acetigenes]|uniref:DUF4320 family protein n=1 Tax=Sporanaerobacter acetigenes DSM 13106 TaxID=1123281 RepID=A0A1M5U7I5_9FIRM|nr:DUF4320 family protein [Sporanaerobacter acetigenes]SHH58947.1 protein of unknown function [Sporanaerobacter acetigenes DSM 13106]